MAVSLSHWFAFLSLGLSLSAAGAVPVVAWVDADYLLVADWQAVGDRLLVETARVRDALRDASRDLAALVILLTTSPKGAMA
ncbi:hypothetical protein AB0D11_02120 [Streptomyces monashensis]|uniref:hypothetical protein n=1 Tax=Streptomyces monashensis TaxID=1678012 RepID=UPI0033C46EF1